MTTRRHDADILVLGYSLEAAIGAALAARRGCKILWIGGVEPTVAVGQFRVAAAPSLMPSLAHAPTLARVLRDVGLLVEVQRVQTAVSLQYLKERQRISLATDWTKAAGGEVGLELLQEMAAVADELSASPPADGFFKQRAFVRRRVEIDSRIGAPDGIVGEAAQGLTRVLGRAERSLGPVLQATAAPSDLPGGTLVLGQMLQRKCAQLGARLFPEGLSQPLKELRAGWSGVEGRLASGEALTARAAIVALDQAAFERAIPQDSPLATKLRPPDSQPLLRLSLVVRRRGLPQPLGVMALLEGKQTYWLERRSASTEHDACSIFWRSDSGDFAAQAAAAREAFGEIAPFLERHIVAEAPAAIVPDHDRDGSYARARLARRLLAARGPLLGLDGPEGAALSGTALADRVVRFRVKNPARAS